MRPMDVFLCNNYVEKFFCVVQFKIQTKDLALVILNKGKIWLKETPAVYCFY